jgi:hypothetical protein
MTRNGQGETAWPQFYVLYATLSDVLFLKVACRGIC